MQKFIITAPIDSLIKASAQFETPADRGADALNVMLSYPDGRSVGFEGRRDADAGTFVFTTYDDTIMCDVVDDFNALKIANKLKSFTGEGIKINVLEMLSAGWLIHAPKGQNVLRVRLPNHLDVEMKYRNDGTSLYAEYDGIDSGGPHRELQRHTLSLLKMYLGEASIVYDVL